MESLKENEFRTRVGVRTVNLSELFPNQGLKAMPFPSLHSNIAMLVAISRFLGVPTNGVGVDVGVPTNGSLILDVTKQGADSSGSKGDGVSGQLPGA